MQKFCSSTCSSHSAGKRLCRCLFLEGQVLISRRYTLKSLYVFCRLIGGAVFSSWICEEYVEYSVGDSALLSACASAEHNTPKLVRTILTYKVSVSNPMPCPRFQEPPAPPNFREIPDIRPPKAPSRSMVKVQEIMENPMETATMKNQMEKT